MMWMIPKLNLNEDALRDSIAVAQFLIKVAQIFHSSKLEIDMKILYDNEKQTLFRIDTKESMKSFKFPANVRVLRVYAKGTGIVNLNFLYKFSTFVDESIEDFSYLQRNIDVETKLSNEGKNLYLKMCVYKDETDSDDGEEDEDEGNSNDYSTKTIMEVNLPKGLVDVEIRILKLKVC